MILGKQQLEVLSAYQFVLSFLFMGIGFTLLLVYLLFTWLWSVSVLYLIWLYLDWDTPQKGGRPSEWIKGWKIWEHVRDYYPVKLVKTAELPPQGKYIFGYHPHGIMCIGCFCNFNTNTTGFSRLFPGLRVSVAGLAGLFKLPIYRDYLMSVGLCPVSSESLDFLLSGPGRGGGQAVVIVVGGANESLDGAPGEHRLTLRRRKGFVRLALKHGASLVPVYSFGENEIFSQLVFKEGSWARRLQQVFKNIMGFSPCLFWGRGLIWPRSWGLLPFRKPVTTVVGRPIPVPHSPNPTPEEVNHYHRLYMEAIEEMFEEHKASCGVPPDKHLVFY
ncbi:2-acylglycerol O-acyltransferase 3 [Ornithorhynchus anatinus]|nr:2-acylglycerol O-acyltransferase 3 [Ornithorhynchus anatinus]XP_028911584.1 2-acylglycerol O-acyltransferase 3 [Ornithorhynchus anatinus]